jgi:hypothetical protein
MNDMEKIFVKNENVVSRQIADEVILVPVRQKVADLNCIYTLNEIGAHIWELIDGKRNGQQLKAMVTEEFEVSAQQAEKDLYEFLAGLISFGLVKET